MSFQQPLIQLIDSRLPNGYTEVVGTATSVVYRVYGQDLGTYLWVMDVDINQDGSRPDVNNILKSVPIADASHGVHKTGPGAKLRLRRGSLKQTYEIVGTAAVVDGQVYVVEVTYSAGSYSQGATTTYGASYSILNYDDLGDSASNGGFNYGTLPYGTLGKYDAQGDLQYVLNTP
jgi:hypothetical protein